MKFAYNFWKYKHTKHLPRELIIEMNSSALFKVLEDPVSTAQNCLKELVKIKQDTQQASITVAWANIFVILGNKIAKNLKIIVKIDKSQKLRALCQL